MIMKTKELITASPIDKLLDRLGNSKGSGNGRWRAKCPVHQGETSKGRTLSVRETETGSVLIHCHAGCPADAVLTQLGLSFSDIMPPEKYTNYSKYLSKPTGKSRVYIQDETCLNIYILDIAVGLMQKGTQLTEDELGCCSVAVQRLKELHHE